LLSLPGEQTSGAARAGGRASQKSKSSTFTTNSFDSKGLQHRAALRGRLAAKDVDFEDQK
jgi:hypothetical protein